MGEIFFLGSVTHTGKLAEFLDKTWGTGPLTRIHGIPYGLSPASPFPTLWYPKSLVLIQASLFKPLIIHKQEGISVPSWFYPVFHTVLMFSVSYYPIWQCQETVIPETFWGTETQIRLYTVNLITTSASVSQMLILCWYLFSAMMAPSLFFTSLLLCYRYNGHFRE